MVAVSQAFRCFDEVARRGSIRKAAETLHLTAAAVHKQVLNFEEQVGTPLFDRVPKGMQLTTAGEVLLAAIRRGQRDFDQALAQVEDMRNLRRGHVSIAVSMSSAEHLVPLAIRKAMKVHPGITYRVRTGSGEQIQRLLEQGEADLGFCLRRTSPPSIEAISTLPQRLGLVSAPTHPLVGLGEALRLRDCLDSPLVLMTADTELRSIFDRLDPRSQRKLRPLVETSAVGTVRQLAADGLAVGFLLLENVIDFVRLGRVAWTPLADAGASCESVLYHRSGQTTSIATGMFRQILEAEMQILEAQMPGV